MPRYVISGRKRGTAWCYYVSRKGVITTTG
jgi:hypothetical protein